MARKKHRDRVFVPYKESKGPSTVITLAFLGVGCAVPIVMPIGLLLAGRKALAMWKNKKNVDYRNYAAIIGNRSEVSVNEFSAKLGKSQNVVISDLQRMIEKGYLGADAFIDRSRNRLVLEVVETKFSDTVGDAFSDILEDTLDQLKSAKSRVSIKMSEWMKSGHGVSQNAAQNRTNKQREIIEIMPEPEKESERVQTAQTAEETTQEHSTMPENQFENYLRRIRDLNDVIADEQVSARIDRIGELTASIYAVVREKPDHKDEVRKFMNYYLPTTFKLLESYALMERQSYQGENIVASRRKIEEILDTLVTAFEHQQDHLFRREAMDVDADIQVLETMMASDGLITPKGSDLRAVMRKK